MMLMMRVFGVFKILCFYELSDVRSMLSSSLIVFLMVKIASTCAECSETGEGQGDSDGG